MNCRKRPVPAVREPLAAHSQLCRPRSIPTTWGHLFHIECYPLATGLAKSFIWVFPSDVTPSAWPLTPHIHAHYYRCGCRHCTSQPALSAQVAMSPSGRGADSGDSNYSQDHLSKGRKARQRKQRSGLSACVSFTHHKSSGHFKGRCPEVSVE